jgi:CRP-like cAMP-binding protein
MTNIVFSGRLEFLDLAELIQLIGNNGFSGVLRLQSNYSAVPGFIYFINGNPVESDIGTLTGIEALNTLFGWQSGDFIFSNERTSKKRVIHKNRMEIILDGLRMVDDGKTKIARPQSQSNVENTLIIPPGKKSEVKGPPVDYIYVVDEETFSDGDIIAQEGRHGGWLWVVLEGMVDIIKETKSGEMFILRLSEGAFVGSFASFLPGDHVRSAAAIARGNVQLGVLDAPRLAGEYAGLTPAFRRFVISIDNRLKEVTAGLIDIRTKKAKSAGGVPKGLEPFALEGERKGGLFVINKGKAAVVRHTDYGHILLANLSPGDSFGHVPFLEIGHEPYAGSIYSSPDLEIETLDAKVLQIEYHRQSTTLKNLLEHVSACISITTQLLFNDFLKGKDVRRPFKK